MENTHLPPRATPTPTRMRLDPSSSISSWCKLLKFSILLILLLTKKSFFSCVSLSTPSMFLSRLKEISRILERAKHLFVMSTGHTELSTQLLQGPHLPGEQPPGPPTGSQDCPKGRGHSSDGTSQ